MSYQSQLNNLMQMATIEQLNLMLTQLSHASNANTSNSSNTSRKQDNTNSDKDVLNLTIVQKVVMAY